MMAGVETSSRELLERVQGGDAAALDRLLERYLPRLRRWAHGRLPPAARDRVDTEDLVQDTVVRAVRRLPSFTPRWDGALAAYLRQAIHNRLRDEARRVAGQPLADQEVPDRRDPQASPLELAIGREAVERYEQALLRIPEVDRAAVIGRLELDLSWSELAEALDKPSPDAARMAAGRALLRLARELGHDV
jgi:RNA polymerase sigma-70 factor (ECF subfamily)